MGTFRPKPSPPKKSEDHQYFLVVSYKSQRQTSTGVLAVLLAEYSSNEFPLKVDTTAGATARHQC